MPWFFVIVINFLCLVASLVISNIGYYLFNVFLHDMVYVNLVRILSTFFVWVYNLQVTQAKWGRFNNIYLFIEINFLLILIGSTFVMIFKKEFFKKAMLNWQWKTYKNIYYPILVGESMIEGPNKDFGDLKPTYEDASKTLKNLNSKES